jgi:hypothetical protein
MAVLMSDRVGWASPMYFDQAHDLPVLEETTNVGVFRVTEKLLTLGE